MKTTPELGSIVRVTNDPDKTRWGVMESNGVRVGLVPADEKAPFGMCHSEQWIDRSVLTLVARGIK